MNILRPTIDSSIDPIVEGQIYAVVPPEVIRHPDGVVENIVAAYSHEVGGEMLRVPVGKVVIQPSVQFLEVPFARRVEKTPTATVIGAAYEAVVYRELNPVLHYSRKSELRKHTADKVAINLHSLQDEATTAVLSHLGIEPPEPTIYQKLKQHFQPKPNKVSETL